MLSVAEACLWDGELGALAEAVTQLAVLYGRMTTGQRYEPPETQLALLVEIATTALDLVDEAGCLAKQALQLAESGLFAGEASQDDRPF